jgi:hypothetical protein
MNRKLISRLLVVPVVLLAGAGCTLKDGHFVTDQPATPVVEPEMVIEIVSDTGALNTASPTTFARLTVKAIRSIVWKFPEDGTKITLTSNLGNFQSQSGPQTLQLELVNGQAMTVFYGGTEAGIANLRASIGGDFTILQIPVESGE